MLVWDTRCRLCKRPIQLSDDEASYLETHNILPECGDCADDVAAGQPDKEKVS